MNDNKAQHDIVAVSQAVDEKLVRSINSPVDALIATSQVRIDLPKLHRGRRRLSLNWTRPMSLRLYRARLDWLGIGIDYVEYGGYLHVIDAWTETGTARRKVDCVFDYPADDSKYLAVREPGADLTVAHDDSPDEPVGKERRTDDGGHFRPCPICRRNDGYLNVRRAHFFTCHTHRTRWLVGENLFSTWRSETEADWKENWALIQDYKDVEPVCLYAMKDR